MSETVYVFLIRRPQDKEAWPTVWRDHKRAQDATWRASDVYQVTLVEKEPINIPAHPPKTPLEELPDLDVRCESSK